MKLKVNIFDKRLLKDYLAVLSVISLLCSFVLIGTDIPDDKRSDVRIGLVCTLLMLYVIMWLLANFKNKTTLNINNSTIEVKIGNIFDEENLKVIAFNEYFDTQVDNQIISENSLNGIYINSKVTDVNELDILIDRDTHLIQKTTEVNNDRADGKKRKHELGTIIQNEEYLLTAFTKFDIDNRAYLNMDDYIGFLLTFWNEIDIFYAGRSVSIPLMGSGITRFKEYTTISEQELLELLIWSFKISRIKFTYPSKVTIVIHESKKDKINFYKLKEN